MGNDRIAVITGGGTGIGAATAQALAQAGVKVVVVGRRPAPLDAVVRAISEQGGTALAKRLDVMDFSALNDLANEVTGRFGGIDLVVANAAVSDQSSIVDGDPGWWHTLVDINVLGVMNTVRAFLPHMYQRGCGHIVIVSSLSGREVYTGEAIYCSSKHATVAFANCLRMETAPMGIRVTVVEPGLVETPLADNPVANDLKKTVKPLEASDCARAIVFAYQQPPNCLIQEIALRPLGQI